MARAVLCKTKRGVGETILSGVKFKTHEVVNQNDVIFLV